MLNSVAMALALVPHGPLLRVARGPPAVMTGKPPTTTETWSAKPSQPTTEPPSKSVPWMLTDFLLAELQTLKTTSEAKAKEMKDLLAALSQTKAAVTDINDELRRAKAAVDDIELDFQLEARALASEQVKVTELQSASREKDAQINGLETSLTVLEQEAANERQAAADLKAQIASLSEALTKLTATEEQVEELGAEKALLAAELQQTCSKLEKALERERTLSKGLDGALQRVAALEEERGRLTAALSTSTSLVEALTLRMETMSTELAETKALAASQSKQLEALGQRITALESERAALETSRAETEARLVEIEARLRAELESTRRELAATGEDLDSTRNELRVADVDLQTTRRELAKRAADLMATRTRLEVTGADLSNKLEELARTRNDLEITALEAEEFRGRSVVALLVFGLQRDLAALKLALRAELSQPTTKLGKVSAAVTAWCLRLWVRLSARVGRFVRACSARLPSGGRDRPLAPTTAIGRVVPSEKSQRPAWQ